ncbi:cell envelope biogenesis protein OmpA [Desulfosarcina sp. OttesenSCG-928-A07]|nr:cell envelope biogenesis protein OmpA [Desulfosarcina sp. OttesenSCG-928-G17]MDL2328753.1 cell envelope biogenesis protein OmpA [Desulfosarcina sp. OttesenSCG-928-A07]
MMHKFLMGFIIAAGCLLMISCGTKKPVFYPNTHLQQVGQSQSRADMHQCMESARQYGISEGTGKEVATRAAKGAVLAGATGAVASAIMGRSVLRTAGAAAAGGATAGAISGVFDADDPDAVFKRYVERCLREKGYEVIGWQ